MIDVEEWRRIVDAAQPPTVEGVTGKLADARDLARDQAREHVEAALAGDEPLTFAPDAGTFGEVVVDTGEPDEPALDGDWAPDESGSTPTLEAAESPRIEPETPRFERWANVDFSAVAPGVWAPAQMSTDAWMCRKESKAPYSPWTDSNAPVECTHTIHSDPTTCDECDHHAGYKWGSEGSREYVHAPHEKAREWAEKALTLSDDLVFIQSEDDPFAFVDGDDVRDPDTGEVHPAFRAFLEHLGITYADVSTSGSGVHALYSGEIPLDGVPEAAIQIDTEPWGANDDPPVVEIYDGKHVCIATGDHVEGTGTEITEWDSNALADILRANGYTERPEPTAEASVDLDDYEPTATESDETTDDIRDIFRALDQLDPKRVGERTIVREWTRGRRSFLPTWGSSSDNGTANYIDDRIWHDTGHDGGYGGPAVMAAIDAGLINHRGAKPSDVSGDTFFKALEHLRTLGFSIPRLDRGGEGDNGDTEEETDPRRLSPEELLESDTTLSRREAWRGARAVTPDHLDEPLDLAVDGDTWLCDACGDHVDDVVRATALHRGTIDCCQDTFDDPGGYDQSYEQARTEHGAPLPEYIPPTQAVADQDRAEGAVHALRGWHILDSLDSEITVDSPTGNDAVAVLDPTWEESESGERIVLFQSGVFYCRKHEQVIWPLQVIALEQGLIDSEDDWLQGNDWLRAYALARTQYGAPLPPIVWNDADQAPEPLHLPVLPDADELLGEGVTTDASGLDAAREDVADLYSQMADRRGSPNYLLTALPALGKTYNVITQADEYPTLYTAKRKELRKEAAEEADDHGISWMHAPTLGEDRPPEAVLQTAVAHVREHGRGALRDRDALLEAVKDTYHAVDDEWAAYEAKYGDSDDDTDSDDSPLPTDPGADLPDEDDDVDLQRASCDCGDGEHGPEWQLAIWTARKLGDKPRDLHVRGETIFGEQPPCADILADCEYTRAWDKATDPDAPIDLFIAHPVHAYVGGARVQPRRTDDDTVYAEDRVVGLDEFPGDVYTTEFDDSWEQHARWLASCLDGHVDDTTDLIERREDLWQDEFIMSYLDGDATPEVYEAIAAARRQADDEDCDDPDWQAILDADWHVYGDLAALVERALEAARDPDRDAEQLLDSAMTALQGGRDGVDALASGAEDGYAHPDAFWLLLGLLAPAGFDGTDRDAEDHRYGINADVRDADHFDFGNDNGRIKTVSIGERVSILVDRDMDGALLLTPPDLRGNTVVGLDATPRTELWEQATGLEFEKRDIHQTMQERRAFLEDVLNLQVVQTSPHVHTYSGNPTDKNFGDDIALVDAVESEFGHQQIAQDRLTTTSAPAVVTTKKVEEYIGDDLRQAGADTVDHYGDLIGSNRLGDHSIGVILGAEHYGHDEAEKWALLAGETFDATGRGAALDYESPTANALLKRMRDDQVMQAIMRFGRDEEGAVVFAHTCALRDDLPVAAQGDVAEAWTANQKAVATAAADRQGQPFTVTDVLEDERVDCHRRTARRLLNEFADLGYLRRDDGHTNEYQLVEDPGTGEASIPNGVDTPATTAEPGQTDVENINTRFVWSCDAETDTPTARRASQPALGPPTAEIGTGPPG